MLSVDLDFFITPHTLTWFDSGSETVPYIQKRCTASLTRLESPATTVSESNRRADSSVRKAWCNQLAKSLFSRLSEKQRYLKDEVLRDPGWHRLKKRLDDFRRLLHGLKQKGVRPLGATIIDSVALSTTKTYVKLGGDKKDEEGATEGGDYTPPGLVFYLHRRVNQALREAFDWTPERQSRSAESSKPTT